MADQKISELNAITGINTADDDLFVIVDTSAGETKKILKSELVSTINAALIDGAPATLDTLNELAAALADDANFATTVTNSLAGKVDTSGDTMTGDLNFGDNDKAVFGAGSDLQIYHDGTHSYIRDTGTGNLNLRGDGYVYIQSQTSGNSLAHFHADAESALYYNNSTKLATTSTGVDVTGTISADGLEVFSSNPVYFRRDSSDTTPTGAFGTEDTIYLLNETDVTGNYTSIGFMGNAGELNARIASIAEASNGRGNLQFYYGNVATGGVTKGMQLSSNGDISFYEDTGTTAKFFWDASAESLGIGTSSPQDTGTGYSNLTVNGTTGGVIDLTDDDVRVGSFFNTANDVSIGNFTATGFLGFRTNSTERMRINSSGNVGIGTSSPNYNLDVRPGTASIINVGVASAYGNTGTLGFLGNRSSIYSEVTGGGYGNTDLRFRTFYNNVVYERMRIYENGDVEVGGHGGVDNRLLVGPSMTSAVGDGRINVQDRGNILASWYYGTTKVGSITTNASSTSYNTSSDYRLKEDWQPMSGSIDRVKSLNPVNFAWKVDGTRVDGFLAHEAQEVVPEAVHGTKDAVTAYGNITDAEGTVIQEDVIEPKTLEEGQTWTKVEDKPVYQGIDQSKLVPLLTAALQEAVAKIESLEARLDAANL
jgi:hypothetical protein